MPSLLLAGKSSKQNIEENRSEIAGYGQILN